MCKHLSLIITGYRLPLAAVPQDSKLDAVTEAVSRCYSVAVSRFTFFLNRLLPGLLVSCLEGLFFVAFLVGIIIKMTEEVTHGVVDQKKSRNDVNSKSWLPVNVNLALMQ